MRGAAARQRVAAAHRSIKAAFRLLVRRDHEIRETALRGIIVALLHHMTAERQGEEHATAAQNGLRRCGIITSWLRSCLWRNFQRLQHGMAQDQARNKALRRLGLELRKLRTGRIRRAWQGLVSHGVRLRYGLDLACLKQEAVSMLRRHSAAHVLSLDMYRKASETRAGKEAERWKGTLATSTQAAETTRHGVGIRLVRSALKRIMEAPRGEALLAWREGEREFRLKQEVETRRAATDQILARQQSSLEAVLGQCEAASQKWEAHREQVLHQIQELKTRLLHSCWLGVLSRNLASAFLRMRENFLVGSMAVFLERKADDTLKTKRETIENELEVEAYTAMLEKFLAMRSVVRVVSSSGWGSNGLVVWVYAWRQRLLVAKHAAHLRQHTAAHILSLDVYRKASERRAENAAAAGTVQQQQIALQAALRRTAMVFQGQLRGTRWALWALRDGMTRELAKQKEAHVRLALEKELSRSQDLAGDLASRLAGCSEEVRELEAERGRLVSANEGLISQNRALFGKNEALVGSNAELETLNANFRGLQEGYRELHGEFEAQNEELLARVEGADRENGGLRRAALATVEARNLERVLERIEKSRESMARAFRGMRVAMLISRRDSLLETSMALDEAVIVKTLEAQRRRAAVQQIKMWLGCTFRARIAAAVHVFHANTTALARAHRHRMEVRLYKEETESWKRSCHNIVRDVHNIYDPHASASPSGTLRRGQLPHAPW